MKIIGSIFIIFASIVSSYYYEKKLKNNIANLENLCNFIVFAKNRIKYFSTPIKQIIDDYPEKTAFLSCLFNGNDNCSLNFLEASIRNDIFNFFNSIGRGFKNEQLDLCDYTISSIESAKNMLKEEFSKKTKIFRSLSLFAGLGCIILII